MEKILTIIFLVLLTIDALPKQEHSVQEDTPSFEYRNVETKRKEEVRHVKNDRIEIQQALLKQFDDKIDVMGMPYPLSESRLAFVNILTGVQYGFIAALLLFDKKLSEASTLWATYVSPSKVKAGFLSYILFNFVIQQLSSSGAFEVFINDHLVHSKINSGQMPTIDTIIRLIQQKI